MTAKIEPGPVFKDNLALLPPIGGLARVDLLDAAGQRVDTIENQPGKQGSLAVYAYLAGLSARLDADVAEHALALFAEHTPDAKARPGAHPNVDRLLQIAEGGPPLTIRPVAADRT